MTVVAVMASVTAGRELSRPRLRLLRTPEATSARLSTVISSLNRSCRTFPNSRTTCCCQSSRRRRTPAAAVAAARRAAGEGLPRTRPVKCDGGGGGGSGGEELPAWQTQAPRGRHEHINLGNSIADSRAVFPEAPPGKGRGGCLAFFMAVSYTRVSCLGDGSRGEMGLASGETSVDATCIHGAVETKKYRSSLRLPSWREFRFVPTRAFLVVQLVPCLLVIVNTLIPGT